MIKKYKVVNQEAQQGFSVKSGPARMLVRSLSDKRNKKTTHSSRSPVTAFHLNRTLSQPAEKKWVGSLLLNCRAKIFIVCPSIMFFVPLYNT